MTAAAIAATVTVVWLLPWWEVTGSFTRSCFCTGEVSTRRGERSGLQQACVLNPEPFFLISAL